MKLSAFSVLSVSLGQSIHPKPTGTELDDLLYHHILFHVLSVTLYIHNYGEIVSFCVLCLHTFMHLLSVL